MGEIMSGEHLKDPEFLAWAKRRGGDCCVCRALSGTRQRAEDNHHFDYRNRGTALKGRDHWLCRLCRGHHMNLQGKGRMWFVNNDELETWTAMVEDALNLLSDFHLESMGRDQKVKVNGDVF